MSSFIDRLIKPDEYYIDLLHIDFAAYAAQGCRLILLDIDNTLARHGAYAADDFAREAVSRILKAGLACRIISNAKHKRAMAFSASLNLPFTAMANKPWPHALKSACREAGIKSSQAVMIGDQLLTDIAAARRAGCRAVLVKPRFDHEAWNVRFKRIFERRALRRFKIH